MHSDGYHLINDFYLEEEPILCVVRVLETRIVEVQPLDEILPASGITVMDFVYSWAMKPERTNMAIAAARKYLEKFPGAPRITLKKRGRPALSSKGVHTVSLKIPDELWSRIPKPKAENIRKAIAKSL